MALANADTNTGIPGDILPPRREMIALEYKAAVLPPSSAEARLRGIPQHATAVPEYDDLTE